MAGVNKKIKVKPFIVKIPVSYIPSENQRLAGRKLTEVARTFKNEIRNALLAISEEDFYKDYSWIYNDMAFRMELVFILNASFWRRDTDNCCKMTIDSIFEWLELNDSAIVTITATKFFAPSSDTEMIIASLYPNEIDYNLYEKKLRSSLNQVSKV